MRDLPLNAIVGNKYRIEKCIGSGGQGEVFRATDMHTGMSVAVKVLSQGEESNTALARFRNEAVIQYNLRHRNVAELYEYFVYHGKPCIAMEFIEGHTLSEWIQENGALPPSDALEILADICDAVSYMHSKGTIHRDIKSENIRINPEGRAKLLDFGISVSKDSPTFTREGYIIGTPAKMSPEQHLGSRGDARSDVWALGVLLYEMVTGSPPFANASIAGLKEDILAQRYLPAARRKPGLPKPVIKLISGCLRSKPEDRFSSSGVMLREIQLMRRGLTSEKWRNLFSSPAMVGGAAGVAIIVAFVYLIAPASPGNGDSQKPTSHVAGDPPSRTPSIPNPAPPQVPVDKPHPRPDSRDVPSASKNIAAEAKPSSPESSGREQKTVRVATYDGPAELSDKEGQVLGSTPYVLTGPVGQTYELWLRRPGFQPRKVDVQINNKSEYMFGLEKLDARADYGKRE